MKTVNSISGGKSSAYLAANYPADYNVFALVRIEDENCRYPDEALRKRVEDRIQAPFIATAEDDEIIHTIFDLEQYLGQKIEWVTGITFDEVIRTKGGWLPNKLHRYCTTNMKLTPIFYWAYEKGILPYWGRVGYRAGEERRVNKMMKRCNKNGFIEFKATFEKHVGGRHDGLNKWEMVEWEKPVFPLVEDRIYRDIVNNFWKGKEVRFADLNNCRHCFHRNPLLINKIAHSNKESRNKLQWAASQEGGDNGYWRSDGSYEEFIEANFTGDLEFDDFSECDSGFCEP